MQSKRIDAQLREVHLAIEGALQNPVILNKLSKVGYTKQVLLQGESLVKEVERLRSWQDEGKGMQKKATKNFRAARQEVHTAYMRHIAIVRLDLDPKSELWDVLKLIGPREQSIAGWLVQVSAFYNNLNRVQEILDAHRITAEEIAQIQAMIQAIDAHQLGQSKGKSEKQRATKQREKALKEVQEWMADFLYIARHALKDDKQLMEALGQVV